MKVRSSIWALLCVCLFFFSSLAFAEESTETAALQESAGGGEAFISSRGEAARLDFTKLSDGIVTALYSGDAPSASVQVIFPDGQVTPYALVPGEASVLALGGGSGSYRINVLEKAESEQFAVILSHAFKWFPENELSPFLQPNAYVHYHEGSECVEVARGLFDAVQGDAPAFVDAVYHYVISNIAYDEDLAGGVPSGYVPDPDAVIERGRGICLDYAALMTAMLRSCGLPARMIAGNFDAYYHTWVSVSEKIPSDGRISSASWKTYDPTLGASNSSSEVRKRLNSGKDYIAKYVY